MSGSAWVTLATNDSYSLGALVLAHSLRQVGTAHQLAVLVTPGVSGVMREKLSAVFNVVREVNVLDSRDEANLRLLQRPDLGITFTKLHCWRLTQFNKCVFLDADTLVLQNADELFEREEFSAAPDVGWPDCFNSGVFVYCPSEDTYGKLIQFALEKGSFDGGDQGLLNLYFSDWAHKDISKHLPFIYNMCSTACYSYLPAYKQFGGNVKILHFIGNAKPWLQYFDTATREVHVPPNLQHLKGFVQHWWNIFCSLVHPTLSSEMARSSATHYASFDSNTRSVPSQRNVPLYYDSFSDNTFTDGTNFQTMQVDHTNVWDPWDEYEKKQDNTPFVLQSSDNPVYEERSQNFENVHTEPFAQNKESTESFVQNVESTQSYQTYDTSVHDIHSSEQFSSESLSCINDNVYNIEDPQKFSTDSSKTHESEYFADSRPAQEPSNMQTSLDSHTIVAQIPSECNQLAWPHECEPASCVTTENALHVKPSEVHDGNAGLAGAFARLTLGVPRTAEQNMLEDHLRRQGWEVGNIDYMGRDSFDNIWSKICATLSDSAPSSAPVQAAPAAPAPAQAAGPSPAAAPAQPQQPVEASEIVSAPKEPPAKAAEVPIAAVLPSEAPKPVESCPKPVPPAEIKPAAESCPRPAPAAASSEIKPSEPESPKPAPPSPSDSSKTASKAPSEPPKESTVCQKPSTPSDIPQPAAVSPPTHAPKVPPQQLESEKSAVAAVAPPLSAPAPAQPQAPAPKSQQTPPSSPAPKAEAAPAPPKSQQTPPSSPAPKAEAAPAPPKSQQTPPSSPAPKAAPPKLPQTPKAEAAPAKSQKTPPSSPSPKTEAAAAPPLKSEQTPPSSPLPKSQPKAAAAAPAKEAAEAPKAAPVKKAASVESPPAEEAGAASGGQGPTPPPRKTGGAASTKKTGKGKK